MSLAHVVRGALLGSLVAVVGFSVVPPAGAATLTVCASGCTHTTITAAVAAANPGDVVDVGSGTYAENGILLTEAITIRGAGPGQTIVDGGGADTSPRVGIFQIRPAAPASSGAGTITVSDMTVRNPAKQGSFYMNFSIGVKQATTGVTDITLDNLTIQGTNDAAKWNYGIYADGGAPISGNERQAPDLVVKNSRFTQTAFNNLGVDAWYGDVTVTNNDFTESVASGNSGIVVLNEYTNAQIPNPITVSGNRSTGRLFYLSNISAVPDKPGWAEVTVSDNTITGLGSGDPGIYAGSNTTLTAAQYRNGTVTVAGNEISAGASAAGSTGVVLGGLLDDGIVEGNTITGTEAGVAVRAIKGSSPTNITVEDNELVGSGTAASVGVVADSDPLHLDVLGNSFEGFTQGVSVGGTGRHVGKVTVTDNELAADGYTTGTTGVALKGLVDDTAIEANDITGWDDGITVAPADGDQPGPVEVLHNRIFADAAGLRNTSTTQVQAASNWWGCQSAPTVVANTFCSTVHGDADVTPWLAASAVPAAPLDDDGTVHVAPGDEVLVDVAFVSTDGAETEAPTGLPALFDNLPVGYDVDGGSFTGPSALNASYQAQATFVAPPAEGVVEARVMVDEESFTASAQRALGQPLVTGEPVVVRFTVESGAVVPPVVDGPGSGPDTGGEVDGPSVLPSVGASYPSWLPLLGLSLLLAGGACAVAGGRKPRRVGLHRR